MGPHPVVMPEGTGKRRPYIMPQLMRGYAYRGYDGLGIRDLGTDGVSGLSKPAQWEDPTRMTQVF